MSSAVPIRQDIPAAELRRHAETETDDRASRRMRALAAVLDGASRAEAARLAGMERRSLRDWVHRFNAEGIEGLHDRPQTGRPPQLSEGQKAAFKALVLRGSDVEKDGVSAWTAKNLCRIVKELYGESYSESGMRKLLHSLDLSWQKTARPPQGRPQATGRVQTEQPSPNATTGKDAIGVDLPRYRDPTGAWRPALELPDELRKPLGDAVLEHCCELGIAERRGDDG